MSPTVVSLSLLALVAGCGGLDNEPFRTGTIRGRVAGHDGSALVSVVGREDLVARPDPEGFFELTRVPPGVVDLLVVISPTLARRLSVEVAGGAVAELGELAAAPTVHFEVYALAPGRQRITGSVFLVGTPLSAPLHAPEDEAEFNVPVGCYSVRVEVVGLGQQLDEVCLAEGVPLFERRITMSVPNGAAGREGCAVSGCALGLTCNADLSCR